MSDAGRSNRAVFVTVARLIANEGRSQSLAEISQCFLATVAAQSLDSRCLDVRGKFHAYTQVPAPCAFFHWRWRNVQRRHTQPSNDSEDGEPEPTMASCDWCCRSGAETAGMLQFRASLARALPLSMQARANPQPSTVFQSETARDRRRTVTSVRVGQVSCCGRSETFAGRIRERPRRQTVLVTAGHPLSGQSGRPNT
jgi:hypothetical protein